MAAEDNDIVSFDADDPEMNAAIKHAQRTLSEFFDAFVKPSHDQSGFCLKVKFSHHHQAEHIWLADINASVMPLEGTIGNEPSLPGYKYLQRVKFEPPQITDWMYVEGGCLVGGFTTRLVRKRLSPAARAQMDANIPFTILED